MEDEKGEEQGEETTIFTKQEEGPLILGLTLESI